MTLIADNSSAEFSYFDEEANTQDLFPKVPEEITLFATFCCIIFIVLGIPGNLLTVVALARFQRVRNATAYFIINLSIADLMFCGFNLPLAVSMYWHRNWVHGDTLCTLFPFFRYGLLAVSIFTVLAITINRYVMIGHPQFYHRMYDDGRYVGVMIAMIWTGAFAAIIPTLFGLWGKFELDKRNGSCTIVPDSNHRSPKTFLFIVAFFMPCIAIFICYARIFSIVRQARLNSQPEGISGSSKSARSKNVNDLHSSARDGSRARSVSRRPSTTKITEPGRMTTKDKKLLWMIVVIFGTFLVCHLPITIQKVMPERSRNSIWNLIGIILIYSTTCVNPIIYVVMSHEYRQAYLGLFFCKTDWTLSSRSHYQSATYQPTEHSGQRNHIVPTDSSNA